MKFSQSNLQWIRNSKVKKAVRVLTLLLLVVLWFTYQKRPRPIAASFIDVSLSPDGTKIAAVAFDNKERKGHLYITSSTGKLISSIEEGTQMDLPAWGGDSKTLFFSSRRKINADESADVICSRSVSDLSPEAVVVAKPRVALSEPVVSSSENRLAYVQLDAKSSRVPVWTTWVYDLTTKQEWSMSPYRNSRQANPTWSSNGSVVAFLGSRQPSTEFQPPYVPDRKNPAIVRGIIWATAKDGFTPHFINVGAEFFAPNNDGSQFALISGRDNRDKNHFLQIVDTTGKETARLKRGSIGVGVVWNSSNTAIFFLDNFYSYKNLQLCRWDIQKGQVSVLQPLNNMFGKILGYRNGTLFYSTTTSSQDDWCKINQLKTE